MTPGWLRHWREILQEALGWDTIDTGQNFGFYDCVVLLDFGLEPIDDLAVLEFFEFTRTPVEVVPADLGRFRSEITRLLGTGAGATAPPEATATARSNPLGATKRHGESRFSGGMGKFLTISLAAPARFLTVQNMVCRNALVRLLPEVPS